MTNKNRYDFLKELELNKLNDLKNQNKETIKSDLNIIFNIQIYFLIYLLLFIPRLFGVLIFILFKPSKSKHYLRRLFFEPFSIFKKISDWFFQARITAYLSIFLVIMFFIQILIIEPNFNINNYLYSFYDLLNGNYYSIVTSIFLHANFGHLFGNLLFLVIFGRVVEKHFGVYVFWIFLFSGIFANLISGFFYFLASDPTPSLGASGGIAGLIFLSILLEPFTFTMGLLIPLPLFIVGWLGILNDLMGYLSGISTNINRMAHLSGYLSLFIMIFFFNIRNRKKVIKGLILNIIMFILLYLILNYLGFGLNIPELEKLV